MTYLCIVPAKTSDGRDSLACNGTKVLLPDGSEVPGVQRITIVGEVNHVWQATLECVVHGPEITGLTDTSARWTVPRSRLHYWRAYWTKCREH